MSGHNYCKAVVFGCIDFRVRNLVQINAQKFLGDDKFDYVGIAGCIKDKDYAMKELEISKRLHHVEKVLLISHEDCGAYGSHATLDDQKRDLELIEREVVEQYPDLQIFKFYQKLDGEFVNLN